jgi:hypothetical protein
MSTIKFIPKDPIIPIFAIKLSPTLHKILETISNENEKLELVKKVLEINPKRVIALKTILDEKQNSGTMIVLFDYIFEHIMPKIDIPFDDNGTFKFKIYDMDFNKEINIENLLKKVGL